MNDTTVQPIVPKIDDQYWFDYSEKLVTNGLEKRDKAAANIQSFVLWLWGIYTASASVGFALSGKELASWEALVIALASATLIAVYAGTVWVQMPVMAGFDPRSPNEIKNVYIKNILSKNLRLQITLGMSIFAAIMVSISLIVASVAKPQKPKEPEKIVAPALTVALIQRSGERNNLSVTSYVSKTNSATIRLIPLVNKNSSVKEKGNSYTYIPTAEGLVQASIPMDDKVNEIMVSVEWEDANGVKMQLSRKASTDTRQKN